MPPKKSSRAAGAPRADAAEIAYRRFLANQKAGLQAWARKQCAGPIVARLLELLDFEAVVDLRTLDVTPVKTTRTREQILGGLAAAGALPQQLLRV